jgi:hypothetical protein
MKAQVMRGFVVGLTALILLSGTAHAAAVVDCDWAASARNIVEPWEKNIRTFYNGQVRVAHLEPACCSAQLLVVYPDHSDVDTQGSCKLVRARKDAGFASIDFAGLRSIYDAKKGLLIVIPYTTMSDDKAMTGTAKVRLDLDKGTLIVE